MSDDDLAAWVRMQVEARAPESDQLDYKEALVLGAAKKPKLKLARDVSSFANERGGVLLYGVPEDRQEGIPIPKPLADCGMVIPKGLSERVESVLLDTIEPPLPELVLRPLTLDEGRSVFFVHHPQSWARPHMVVGYEHARYYRRGNFRAVPMKEREVEAAYASRRSVAVAAESFFASGDFGPHATDASLRIIVVPHLRLSLRSTMRSPAFRDWLLPHQVANRRGTWLPFIGGWRFHAHAAGLDVRVFYSGALCCTLDASPFVVASGGNPVLRLPLLSRVLRPYILDVAVKVWDRLQLTSPVTIRCELRGLSGCTVMAEAGWEFSYFANDRPQLTKQLAFVEESTTSEIQHTAGAVVVRLLDHVAAAGGLWVQG